MRKRVRGAGGVGAPPAPPFPRAACEDLVTLQHAAVEIERVPVLREVSLTVAAGEAVGVIGPNGCGKSTLLRVLATLLVPSGGSGRVLGAELGTRASVAVRPRIGLVEHAPALYPQLTLRENLSLLARLTGQPEVAADEALQVVGLARAGTRRADRCSQGMQRRAALARVLITDPSLLLLDEVTSGLDRDSVGLVEMLVGQVRCRGGAAVLVSHDRDQLATITDRLVELVGGTVRSVGARDRRESA